MKNEYPEVLAYISTHDLPAYTSVECSSEHHDYYYFNGFSETNEDGIFYNEDVKINGIKITRFMFPDDQHTKVKGTYLYEFYIYEPDSEEENKLLINFIPSISRMFNKHKEGHEFFVKENRVYLYYYGFP